MRRIARHAAGLVFALAAIAPLVPLAAARQEEDAAKPEATAAKKREAWDAVFLGGKKVGYIHTQVEPVTASDGRKLLRVQVDTVLALKRLNDKTEIKTRYGTIETYEGEVLRLDSRTLVGPQEIRISGDAHAGIMPLTLDAGGQTQRLSIPWGADVRGPYGPEMSLSRQPMQPGETREVKTFIPDLNQVGLTEMEAQQYGEIELGGGAVMNLMRVDSRVLGPDGRPLPGMDSTYYVDAAGQILKSETDVFGGLVTYRTTREAALKPATGGFPIVENLIVKVSRRITNPESTRSAAYAVNFDGEEPIAELFPRDDRQAVVTADDGSTQLQVRTVGPDTNAVAGADPEYLSPNPMINSADPKVVALTQRATSNAAADAWSKATAITQWVAQNVREKNFETTFATAADVAQTLSGDCSEHAVLTAAMCRAAGIPCRVVVGLLYADNLQGFGFHMWNEVAVGGRWVAIDSALGQTEVDATHLKLNESSLEGISPFASFLDVVRVAGKLTLEPLQVQ